eukprot:m.492801 g.492801  ORF g.492801 m.492801 type:complete len:897 (+) comp21786_c0_seq2:46-2736(+)
MRLRSAIASAALVLACACATAQKVPDQRLQGPVAMIGRVLYPAAADLFDLRIDDNVTSENDWCQQAGSPVGECVILSDAHADSDAQIAIRASSISSLTYGIGIYLRTACNASLTWYKTGGLNARTCAQSGSSLPVVGSPRVYTRALKWTYYQNVVDSSYSFAFYDLNRWVQEIDWMALHGVNLALVYTGQEKILLELYKQFGVDLTTNTSGNLDFFNGPAFLSWSRGQGMAGTGGLDAFSSQNIRPDTPTSAGANGNTSGALPAWWFESQAALGREQATRMRELGITTILRGFEGNVPGQLKTLHPTANISQVSDTNWLLDALDPLFQTLADAYMKLLIAEFGTDHFYQADGFFNNKRGPWLHDDTAIILAPCTFSAAVNNTYIANCANGKGTCEGHATLAAAEAACVRDTACGGITFQYGQYQLRADHTATPSPSGKFSISWIINNTNECRPPPTPPPIDNNAKAHAAAAYKGLANTDPEAVWVYQTWIWRSFDEGHLPYLHGWLSAIPEGKGLMLDQTAEWIPLWKNFNSWSFAGTAWVWCAMSTMGGNVGLYGDMEMLNQGPVDAIAAKTSIAGVGIDPEGIDTNPAYYTFMLDSAWRNATVNVTEWLRKWSVQRCGRYSDNAAHAWDILAMTVYGHAPQQTYEHHMAYCPTTMPVDGSGWDRQHGSERPAWYTAAQLHTAWTELLAAQSTCDPSDAFTFDLVDVGREYLSIHPCNDAFDALVGAKTPKQVVAANATMSTLMADLDRLLQTSRGFLLGYWVEQVRNLSVAAGAAEDADFLEWNARAQVTSWDPSSACDGTATSLDGLWDYGNKAWSGLVAGYYDRRYQIYATQKVQKLTQSDGEVRSNNHAYQGAVMQLACEFARQRNADLPSTPQGNAFAVAQELIAKYPPQ